jgi:hypothetical protein
MFDGTFNGQPTGPFLQLPLELCGLSCPYELYTQRERSVQDLQMCRENGGKKVVKVVVDECDQQRVLSILRKISSKA